MDEGICGQAHWDGGLEGGVEAHGTHVWNSLGNGAIT